MNSSLYLYHLQSKDAFQFLGRESELELAFDGYADSSRLFRNDNGNGITALRDTKGSTVAESQFLGNIQVVTHGKDTA